MNMDEYLRVMRSHKAAGGFTGWPDMVQTPPLLYCFKGQTAKGVPGPSMNTLCPRKQLVYLCNYL